MVGQDEKNTILKGVLPMMSVYGCKTKKELKARIGQDASSVLLETSLFGPELRDGKHCIVGPSPYDRKWYAEIMVANGKLLSVK